MPDQGKAVQQDGPLRLRYVEVRLDEVCQFFADHFEPKPQIAEWFVDNGKRKVVFKLYVTEAPDA